MSTIGLEAQQVPDLVEALNKADQAAASAVEAQESAKAAELAAREAVDVTAEATQELKDNIEKIDEAVEKAETKSDWAENNTEAVSHIENRTHYKTDETQTFYMANIAATMSNGWGTSVDIRSWNEQPSEYIEGGRINYMYDITHQVAGESTTVARTFRYIKNLANTEEASSYTGTSFSGRLDWAIEYRNKAGEPSFYENFVIRAKDTENIPLFKIQGYGDDEFAIVVGNPWLANGIMFPVDMTKYENNHECFAFVYRCMTIDNTNDYHMYIDTVVAAQSVDDETCVALPKEMSNESGAVGYPTKMHCYLQPNSIDVNKVQQLPIDYIADALDTKAARFNMDGSLLNKYYDNQERQVGYTMTDTYRQLPSRVKKLEDSVVQERGQSETAIMSQKAVTQLLFPNGGGSSGADKHRVNIRPDGDKSYDYANTYAITIGNTWGNSNMGQAILIGTAAHTTVNGGICIGRNGKIESSEGVILGHNAAIPTKCEYSVAIGEYSRTSRAYEVSIGGDRYPTRYLANVTAGELDTDAVNLKQMKDYVTEVVGTSVDTLNTIIDGEGV